MQKARIFMGFLLLKTYLWKIKLKLWKELIMKNCWNKIRYTVMNVLHIKPSRIPKPDYDRIYTEDFRTTDRWELTYPSTVTTSRNNGATIALKQINSKALASPSLISKTTVEGGCVTIKAILSTSDKVIHIFSLRHRAQELGFKITGGKIYVAAPYHIPSFKLYKPLDPHTFEIDVNPTTDMVYWRVDGIKVYEIRYPSHDAKHLMISMPTIRGRINPKELPISCNIQSVDFLTNNAQHLTRTNEE
jgi:hypothetical protein